MNKAKLKELLIQHKRNFLNKKGLVEREAQAEVQRYLHQKEMVIITGIRRSGKSSLLRLVCDDLLKYNHAKEADILYLNFEDERFIEFSTVDFEALYESFLEIENPGKKKFFFLDEIQNIHGWEKWVNRLYEFESIKIFITGSNAELLKSKISTALTGRHRQLIIMPFSFKEFLTFNKYHINEKKIYYTEEKAALKKLFVNFTRLGGFPEIVKNKDITLLEQYFKDILYRDVISGYALRNVRELKELTLYLSSNLGCILSYKNLQRMIDVKSISTVKNYLDILHDVYLYYPVDLFDYSLKRQIYNPSKIYCADIALNNSFSFKFSKNTGRLYENLIFIELLRHKYEIFYWKSKKGKELDFVTKKGRNIENAIQVVTSLSDVIVKEREINGILAAVNELNPKNLLIITEDEEGEEKIRNKKIQIIPIWKWLLMDK